MWLFHVPYHSMFLGYFLRICSDIFGLILVWALCSFLRGGVSELFKQCLGRISSPDERTAWDRKRIWCLWMLMNAYEACIMMSTIFAKICEGMHWAVWGCSTSWSGDCLLVHAVGSCWVDQVDCVDCFKMPFGPVRYGDGKLGGGGLWLSASLSYHLHARPEIEDMWDVGQWGTLIFVFHCFIYNEVLTFDINFMIFYAILRCLHVCLAVDIGSDRTRCEPMERVAPENAKCPGSDPWALSLHDTLKENCMKIVDEGTQW